MVPLEGTLVVPRSQRDAVQSHPFENAAFVSPKIPPHTALQEGADLRITPQTVSGCSYLSLTRQPTSQLTPFSCRVFPHQDI